jgi:hypothetical protein
MFGRIEDKHGVDEPGYVAPSPDEGADLSGDEPEETVTASTGSIALAALGGIVVAVSVFLPLDESDSPFGRVAENSLIQHGGWWLLIIGAVIALAAVATRQAGAVILLSLVAGAAALHFGSDKSLRTLYPIVNGEAQSNGNGTVVPLGKAVYVAGAGALLAFVGGLAMLSSRKVVTPEPVEETKRCPECAETILAAARVCKHCGYRLG